MANLYVTELAGLQVTPNSNVIPAAVMPAVASQTLLIGAASVSSAAFQAPTQILRLLTEANCFVDINTTPTASTNTIPLIANIPEYVQVPRGKSFKIAVINRA